MLEMLCRIYGVLLFVYPRQFREQYAVEMRRVFREKARDVLRAHGRFGAACYCGRVAWDLVISATREHSAAESLSPLSTRFAMFGCLAVIMAILWTERPHGRFLYRGAVGVRLGQGEAWLALYGFSSLLVTAKRNWARYSLGRSTRYGLLGAALCVAVTLVFFFTLPWFAARTPGESMILMSPIAALALWAAAAFRAARESRSAFTGIVTAVWSSMVSVSFHLAVSLIFWEIVGLKFRSLRLFLPIPWNLSATTPVGIIFGTLSWLQWGVIMGATMGIVGGLAGARRRATPLRPTW
ncbi:MAG TPA: hypothetical protein VGM43_22345 [Bryobacteraceae bacterium]|jgi:hypothetical protein